MNSAYIRSALFVKTGFCSIAVMLVFVVTVLLPPIVFAQTSTAPGPNFGGAGSFSVTNTPSLSVVVQRVYNLAMMLAGIIAFGAVVYGAFMYTFSAGNPGMQSDARDQIFQAFLGLALLLGSYLILNTINPEITKIVLAPLPQVKPADQLFSNSPGQGGSCTPPTIGEGTVSNLTNWFGDNATIAAQIVAKESNGDPNAKSGLDVCADGNAFSYGLFQINLTVHAEALGCGSGVFNVTGQPRCLAYTSDGKYCNKYDCKVVDQAAYNNCVRRATDPKTNIDYAAALFKRSGWSPWANTKIACGIR